MERIAIVSSADHKYHHLLIELISSVRRHGPPGRFAICVLDAGMTPEQVSRLTPLVDEISQCRWEFELPTRRVRGRESLKANLCRPFIPDYFPGYDVYVWLDADTWVADWEAIDLYVTGAARMALAITAQTDRAYQDPVRVSWFLGIPFRVKTFYYSNARRAFGRRLARSLIGCNILNAGAFALRRDAPHWAAWKRLMADALVKGRPFTADQLTLGLLVYREGAAVEILPAWCNWLAEMTPPAFAPDLGQFVEPYLPHHRIGVMHLAGLPAMRSDRAVTMEVRRVGGGTERRSLRYPDPIVVVE